MVNTDDVLLFASETAGSKQEENTYPKKLIKKIFYCWRFRGICGLTFGQYGNGWIETGKRTEILFTWEEGELAQAIRSSTSHQWNLWGFFC